jgi:hypothetical protein
MQALIVTVLANTRALKHNGSALGDNNESPDYGSPRQNS